MNTDTLVVGAGSSGCLLAARLSAAGDRRVTLIEAGPDHLPAELPADLADGHRNAMRSHDWGHRHRPASTLLRLPLPRGRVVGGSSAVNTCIAIRPLPRDLAEWTALGLTGWSYSACLPAMRSIESDLDLGELRPELHGRDGPLPLRRHPESAWRPWQRALVEAALELGFPACGDTNDPDTPEGVGPHAMNQIDGRRISAAEAWLTPAVRDRPNLTILPHTRAVRLQFDGARCVGLEVRREGKLETIDARRVILCAGALHTPAVLLRSGLGPPEELDRLGVPLRASLPGVGARLLDHAGFAMFLRPRRPEVLDKTGPLIQTVLRCSSGLGPWPHDLQLQVGSCVPIRRRSVPLVSIMAMLCKPHGHGTIRWPSLGLNARPVIASRFHEDPRDLERAVAAMGLAARLAGTAAMGPLATHFWPSARVVASPERIARWLPWATDSGYHPCGTAPMGPEDDPLAVTDDRGAVRGVEGVWIADASLFPTIPTGNIHLTVLMVAERLAGWWSAT